MSLKTNITASLSLIFIAFACKEVDMTEKIEPINHRYKFKSEILEQFESSTESWKGQLAAWEYSYIGEYEETLKAWDNSNGSIRDIDSDKFSDFKSNYRQRNALEYILNLADSSQVLIINEAHHQPYHRVFTTELLTGLYERGYKYFGLETLDRGEDQLNYRKYPIYPTGTYSIEPQFGGLIRKALEMGYELFPYESDGNGTDREIGQARNIQAQMRKDPDSKYLIHCGFAHAAEGEYESWGKAMAGRLHDFTGINPLTVNQTSFTEKSEDRFANPIFQQLSLKESSVYLDSNDVSFKHETQADWFDILVFHPKTIMESGRPNWLFRNNKKKVNLSLSELKLEFPVLIFAFKDNEDYSEAVPVDIVYAENKEKEVTLALEDGIYNVIFQNQKGEAFLKKINTDD